MTLDEAIKHCEEVAEKNEEECKNWTYGASRINDDESRKKHYLKHAEMWKEYAKEHRQLAEWLKLLKEITESGDCNNCLWKGKCDMEPELGRMVRYNCYAYARKQEES